MCRPPQLPPQLPQLRRLPPLRQLPQLPRATTAACSMPSLLLQARDFVTCSAAGRHTDRAFGRLAHSVTCPGQGPVVPARTGPRTPQALVQALSFVKSAGWTDSSSLSRHAFQAQFRFAGAGNKDCLGRRCMAQGGPAPSLAQALLLWACMPPGRHTGGPCAGPPQVPRPCPDMFFICQADTTSQASQEPAPETAFLRPCASLTHHQALPRPSHS